MRRPDVPQRLRTHAADVRRAAWFFLKVRGKPVPRPVPMARNFVAGIELRRAGRGGPVPRPAGERGGVQLRRKEPDPGLGPDAAGVADHREVLRFLREVEKTVPKDQGIHIVLDNYATHKHDKVLGWIERKKRIYLHFTPTNASWANRGAFLRDAGRQANPAQVFTSVPHLDKCLREYLDSYNESPRPCVRTKTVAPIIDKVGRARTALAKTA